MKDKQQDASKVYPAEEGLAKFIKTIVDTHYALENANKTPNVWLGVFHKKPIGESDFLIKKLAIKHR